MPLEQAGETLERVEDGVMGIGGGGVIDAVIDELEATARLRRGSLVEPQEGVAEGGRRVVQLNLLPCDRNQV